MEVRVFARLACEVVVLPVLLVQHVKVKIGVQGDGDPPQPVVELAVPASYEAVATVTFEPEL